MLILYLPAVALSNFYLFEIILWHDVLDRCTENKYTSESIEKYLHNNFQHKILNTFTTDATTTSIYHTLLEHGKLLRSHV